MNNKSLKEYNIFHKRFATLHIITFLIIPRFPSYVVYDIEMEARHAAWNGPWQEAIDQVESFLEARMVKLLRELKIPKSYHHTPRNTSKAFIWTPNHSQDYENENSPRSFSQDEGLEFYVELILGKDVNARYLKRGIGRVSISEFPNEQEIVYFPKELRIPQVFFDYSREDYAELVVEPHNNLLSVYQTQPLGIERRAQGTFIDYTWLLPRQRAYF